MPSSLQRLFADYGMLLVLLLLCGYYSWATLSEQFPVGQAAAGQVAKEIASAGAKRVLIVAREQKEDALFADSLVERLKQTGIAVTGVIKGQPGDARQALEAAATAEITERTLALRQQRQELQGIGDVALADGFR
jgi:ribose transport system permease protein